MPVHGTNELHWAFTTLHEMRRLERIGGAVSPIRIARGAHLSRQAVYRALAVLSGLGMVELTGKATWNLTAQAKAA